MALRLALLLGTACLHATASPAGQNGCGADAPRDAFARARIHERFPPEHTRLWPISPAPDTTAESVGELHLWYLCHPLLIDLAVITNPPAHAHQKMQLPAARSPESEVQTSVLVPEITLPNGQVVKSPVPSMIR